MSNKKKIIIGSVIVAIALIIIMVVSADNCSCASNNPVAGTYQGDVLNITLKGNKSFDFYNEVSGTSAKGKYSFTVSDDGKKATVIFTVTSGSFSYDGAVVYFFDSVTYLSPTIGGREVVARRMVKV